MKLFKKYMSLFETILCKNREFQNLNYHTNRLNESRLELFGSLNSISLEDNIRIPDWIGEGLFRCRVDYAETITKTSFFEYSFKNPKRIKFIEDASIDYHLKYANRMVFDKYLNENPEFDDVIFLQNGFITDSTYTNIALFDGKDWFTPQSFLLNGTKRQSLLDQNLLKVSEISIHEINKYSKIAFINAMRGLELAYTFKLQSDVLFIN